MLDFSAQIGSLLLKSYWVSFYTRVTHHHSVWCYESQKEDKKGSLFHMKMTVSVTKSSHQNRGQCFLHLYIFFIHTLSSFFGK